MSQSETFSNAPGPELPASDPEPQLAPRVAHLVLTGDEFELLCPAFGLAVGTAMRQKMQSTADKLFGLFEELRDRSVFTKSDQPGEGS